jgi:hypothetical protein
MLNSLTLQVRKLRLRTGSGVIWVSVSSQYESKNLIAGLLSPNRVLCPLPKWKQGFSSHTWLKNVICFPSLRLLK